MYRTHFGLAARPFPATPDTASYYPATEHEQILERLLQALEAGDGAMLLTGDAGAGKTLLCHCLLERLQAPTSTAFLTSGRFEKRRDLLQAILYDLAQPYQGSSEGELRLRLTDFLLNNFAAGQHALLIVDEAQHLSADALEEIRLLGNLEAGRRRALHVLLAAQPSMSVLLARPEAAAFAQRLAVRARLHPLGVEEAVDYLLHHVRISGGKPEAIFSDEALEILARGTRGIPRLLNQAAQQALLLAEQLAAEQVDAEVALETLSALGLANTEAEEPIIVPVESAEPLPDTPAEAMVAYRLYEQPRRPA